MDFLNARLGCPHAVAAQGLVDLLRGVRQVRGEQNVAVRDHLQGGPQHGGETLALGVVLSQLPRLLVGDVGVRLADDVHRGGDAGLELGVLQRLRDGVEGLLSQREDLLVCLLQRARLGHLAEVLVRHRHGAVDQVSPAVGHLVVDAADELVPGEVGVGVFRAGHGDEVAQRIRAELLEEVLDVNDHALGRGELGARHGEELRGDDFGGQLWLAVLVHLAALGPLARVAQKLRRPDLGVEGDVVFALEVVVQGIIVQPVVLPRLRGAGAVGPLDGGRQVTDDRIEPDVELLGTVVAPAINRHRHAPVDVASHGARAHVIDEVEGELQHVRAPVLAGLQPLLEGLAHRREVEQEVLGVDELRRFSVDLGTRVDEVDRIQLVAAVIALVAAGIVRAADGAGAFDVAVRQSALRRRGDSALGGFFDHVAVLVEALEQLLDHRVVVPGGGAGKQVVGQAEPDQVLDNLAVVAVRQFTDVDAFLIRLDQKRGAVLVGAGDHEHVVAIHSLESCEDVRRNAKARDMSNMSRAIGVGPSNVYNHSLSHAHYFNEARAGRARRIGALVLWQQVLKPCVRAAFLRGGSSAAGGAGSRGGCGAREQACAGSSAPRGTRGR